LSLFELSWYRAFLQIDRQPYNRILPSERRRSSYLLFIPPRCSQLEPVPDPFHTSKRSHLRSCKSTRDDLRLEEERSISFTDIPKPTSRYLPFVRRFCSPPPHDRQRLDSRR